MQAGTHAVGVSRNAPRVGGVASDTSRCVSPSFYSSEEMRTSITTLVRISRAQRPRCVVPGWSASSLPSTLLVRRFAAVVSGSLPLPPALRATAARPSSLPLPAPVIAVYVFSQPSVHEFIFANVRARASLRAVARLPPLSPTVLPCCSLRARRRRPLQSPSAALASGSGGTFSSRTTRTRTLRPKLPHFGASAPPRRLLPQEQNRRSQRSSTDSAHAARGSPREREGVRWHRRNQRAAAQVARAAM